MYQPQDSHWLILALPIGTFRPLALAIFIIARNMFNDLKQRLKIQEQVQAGFRRHTQQYSLLVHWQDPEIAYTHRHIAYSVAGQYGLIWVEV